MPISDHCPVIPAAVAILGVLAGPPAAASRRDGAPVYVGAIKDFSIRVEHDGSRGDQAGTTRRRATAGR